MGKDNAKPASLLGDILEHNRRFVETGAYRRFRTTKYPNKKMVILTCMDTRLIELLPRAMNLRNGDAKLIKSAGAVITHPYGSIMRSILVAIYQLNAREVYVVGHHGCGMTGLHSEDVLQSALKRGISAQAIEEISKNGVDVDRWLSGFGHEAESVASSVEIVRNHPLLPPNTPVHGLLIHPETGQLEVVTSPVIDSEDEPHHKGNR